MINIPYPSSLILIISFCIYLYNHIYFVCYLYICVYESCRGLPSHLWDILNFLWTNRQSDPSNNPLHILSQTNISLERFLAVAVKSLEDQWLNRMEHLKLSTFVCIQQNLKSQNDSLPSAVATIPLEAAFPCIVETRQQQSAIQSRRVVLGITMLANLCITHVNLSSIVDTGAQPPMACERGLKFCELGCGQGGMLTAAASLHHFSEVCGLTTNVTHFSAAQHLLTCPSALEATGSIEGSDHKLSQATGFDHSTSTRLGPGDDAKVPRSQSQQGSKARPPTRFSVQVGDYLSSDLKWTDADVVLCSDLFALDSASDTSSEVSDEEEANDPRGSDDDNNPYVKLGKKLDLLKKGAYFIGIDMIYLTPQWHLLDSNEVRLMSYVSLCSHLSSFV